MLLLSSCVLVPGHCQGICRIVALALIGGLQVITKLVDGHKYEPFEEAVIEVPEEHVGPVVDMLGQRKGQMMDLVAGTDTTSLTRCRSHVLIGFGRPSAWQRSCLLCTHDAQQTPQACAPLSGHAAM